MSRTNPGHEPSLSSLLWGLTILGFLLLPCRVAHAASHELSFGVLSQRSAVLTAEYWNPILEHVSRQVGIPLNLQTARTAPETNQAIERGAYDLVYSNTIFQPRMLKEGYQVILKPRSSAIRGQLVALEESDIRAAKDLANQTVGFPSRGAFVGYAVPMDHLLRATIPVQPVFGGNQEGIMGQLKARKVVAAGVNDEVMRLFAQRENLRYRVLWESEPFENLPIAAHPRVKPDLVAAIRQAFAAMPEDPEGMKILETAAQVIKQSPPLGFRPSRQADYQNYIGFYQTTLVQDYE
ncbi:MAG: phosphate/phosphite/phosphonate ABC transporter substrate-binding protein [Magnetococcales bacterium]|nr:phosphate/phosphite/phosphonate ABC transporter substrate-binding protein [Magnetococcales bacterium]